MGTPWKVWEDGKVKGPMCLMGQEKEMELNLHFLK